MADINDIKDYVEKRSIYDGLSNFFSTGNTLNKSFYSALIIFLVFGSFMFLWAKASDSDYKFTWNKVHLHDKLYAEPSYVNDTSNHSVYAHRLVRRINASDIMKMKVEDWKKKELINTLEQSDTIGKPLRYIIGADIAFEKDTMYKYETAYLGNFLKRDSVGEYAGFGLHWYKFQPVKNKWRKHYRVVIPEGYVLADSDYYVSGEDVRLEEVPKFKK